MDYQGKKVLVTGGLGFIGSNLVLRAVELGAEVTIVDSSVEGCGANLHNIAAVRDRVELIPLDIGQAAEFASVIAGSDVIFNLAGEISHLHSMEFPERDLELNTTAQLRFLNVCRGVAAGIRIVYAGTRQIYGVPQYLPVDELHPVNPVDFNGIHKYAATMYHLMLTRNGCLDAMVLRLTNVYGPRMALHIPMQGFLSAYLRALVRGEGLEVYGDGAQLRDPVYVDDVVEAFLLAGAFSRLPSTTYNVGGPEVLSIAQIACAASQAAGGAPVRVRPFPEELKTIDIGSYYTDSARIERDLGWRARVRLAEGLSRSLAYYRGEPAHDPGLESAVRRPR
ncbi:MAG: NAD-dependent epimerase/dehydratase family protein [Acidobacteria bacterium]|nr:NAD-dependent epimerase/dehydratase family protein [Acidobacteriota bacterium]MBI3472650.1 NAD-dependent epimerase/dehydratase family protein [Candidatus Solibacter usitatus]